MIGHVWRLYAAPSTSEAVGAARLILTGATVGFVGQFLPGWPPLLFGPITVWELAVTGWLLVLARQRDAARAQIGADA